MYKLIACAGTFDHLHRGHRYFLSQAFRYGSKVIIGLTSDSFVREKLKSQNFPRERDPRCCSFSLSSLSYLGHLSVESFSIRKKNLEDFLKEKNFFSRAKIIKIDDIYGPAAEKNEIEALVVTSETVRGARLVNQKRKLLHLKPLKLLKLPMVLADDHRKIASSRIRSGEIDRRGRICHDLSNLSILSDLSEPPRILKPAASSEIPRRNPVPSRLNRDWYWGNLFSPISDDLRQILKKPQGLLLRGDPQNHLELASKLKNIIAAIQPVMVSTIGDEVTKLCNQIDIKPNLAIFDYKVRRIKVYDSLNDLGFARGGLANAVMTVRNPAGHITKTLVEAVAKSIKKYLKTAQPQLIRVLGEEDLSGVPAILLSPLGSVVLYGQPEEGVVFVEVTEEKKRSLLQLIFSITDL